MIFIGKSPYRISLLGGGSDLDWFVEREGHGTCLGYSLDKYSYSVLNVLPQFAKYGILNYSVRETYQQTTEIAHPLIKSVLDKFPNLGFIELSTFGFASGGSGLGGSSAFLLSLIAALNASYNHIDSVESIAHIACEIEIKELSKPIGRQDQYLSALGGINALSFKKNGGVIPLNIGIDKLNMLNRVINDFYLVPSFKTRPADKVLMSLKDDPSSINSFKDIRNIAKSFIELDEARDHILEESFHQSMRESWEIKKEMTNVMNPSLNEQYNQLKKIPNNWIRLIGAGSGGYFLISPKTEQEVFESQAIDMGFNDFSKASLSNQGLTNSII
tara:strand:+ start:1368 stop:2357 length:990 start_codon:yes stop_codon:yes gene_type:complete